MTNTHAKYSPSSSHRWLNCSAYQKFLETLPEQLKPIEQKNYTAKEGSAAHRLAELCFRLKHKPELYLNKSVVLDDGTDFIINQEIIDGVNIYLNYIYKLIDETPNPNVWGFEEKVKIPHPTQKLFGTPDFYIDKGLEGFEIVDFKFGRQDVSPEYNSQLLIYMLGVIEARGCDTIRVQYYNEKMNKPDKFQFTVVQPRSIENSQPIKTWKTNLKYLAQFKTKVFKGIDLCSSSKLIFSVGKWCRYCPAAHLCPILSNKIYETAKALVKTGDITIPCAEDLTPVELVKALDFAGVIEGWIKDVRSYAEKQIKQGKIIDGYKLVAKKGYRKWVDEDNTKKVLTTLGDKLYSERKLISPSQAEKLGIDKDTISKLVTKTSSGVNLVKSSVIGQEVLPPPKAKDVFKKVN